MCLTIAKKLAIHAETNIQTIQNIFYSEVALANKVKIQMKIYFKLDQLLNVSGKCSKLFWQNSNVFQFEQARMQFIFAGFLNLPRMSLAGEKPIATIDARCLLAKATHIRCSLWVTSKNTQYISKYRNAEYSTAAISKSGQPNFPLLELSLV